MATTDLIYRREGGIVTATLNRGPQLNALNKGLFDDFKSMLDVLETDKTVRVLIITGSGEKSFCVGADLKERQGMNEKDILLRMDFVHKLYLRLERAPFPVIAAVNGIAFGGGLELALAADLRVASENATFGFPEVELAIIPGNGGTQRLGRIVGMGKALELVLLAKKMTASEALSIGLINKVVATGQALSAANDWAQKLLKSGPLGLKSAKMAIRGGIERPIDQGMAFELEAYRGCLYSKDRLEGLKAFAEKREPVYKGE